MLKNLKVISIEPYDCCREQKVVLEYTTGWWLWKKQRQCTVVGRWLSWHYYPSGVGCMDLVTGGDIRDAVNTYHSARDFVSTLSRDFR